MENFANWLSSMIKLRLFSIWKEISILTIINDDYYDAATVSLRIEERSKISKLN